MHMGCCAVKSYAYGVLVFPLDLDTQSCLLMVVTVHVTVSE